MFQGPDLRRITSYNVCYTKLLRGSKFEAGIGAEAVKAMLQGINLNELYGELKADIKSTGSVAKRQKLSKRLKIVDAFRKSGVDPIWMIMDVIPVLPPDLRRITSYNVCYTKLLRHELVAFS